MCNGARFTSLTAVCPCTLHTSQLFKWSFRTECSISGGVSCFFNITTTTVGNSRSVSFNSMRATIMMIIACTSVFFYLAHSLPRSLDFVLHWRFLIIIGNSSESLSLGFFSWKSGYCISFRLPLSRLLLQTSRVLTIYPRMHIRKSNGWLTFRMICV